MPSPECPDLTGVSTLFLEINGNQVPYFVESISLRGDKAFLKMEDVNTPEGASALKGTSVFLKKDDRPSLPRGEFYNDEVIGFTVQDKALGTLGLVRDVEEAGPNRFLVLDVNQKEILIPVHGPFIQSLNKTKKLITVDLPEGFLDI